MPSANFPISITLYITYQCQLKCPHCFLVETNQLNRFALSLADILNVVDDAAKSGVFMIVISGGDPLLHPDIVCIVQRIRKHGMLPLLGITGITLEQHHIAMLRECAVPTVQLSLDGASEQVNDAIRGTGTFSTILRNTKTLVRNDIAVNLATCLHQGNIGDLPAILDLARTYGVSRVKLAFYRPYQRNENNIHALTADQINSALTIAREFQARHEIPDFITSPLYAIDTGKPFPHIQNRKPLVVSATGDICIGEEGDCIGHIHEDTIYEAYARWQQTRCIAGLEQLITKYRNSYHINSIIDTTERLPASAMLVVYENSRDILCQSGLPPALRSFLILHEIGHIATNTLSENPHQEYMTRVEERVNIWALNIMRKHLKPERFPLYLEKASHGERQLYQYIEKNLENDLIPIELNP